MAEVRLGETYDLSYLGFSTGVVGVERASGALSLAVNDDDEPTHVVIESDGAATFVPLDLVLALVWTGS